MSSFLCPLTCCISSSQSFFLFIFVIYILLLNSVDSSSDCRQNAVRFLARMHLKWPQPIRQVMCCLKFRKLGFQYPHFSRHSGLLSSPRDYLLSSTPTWGAVLACRSKFFSIPPRDQLQRPTTSEPLSWYQFSGTSFHHCYYRIPGRSNLRKGLFQVSIQRTHSVMQERAYWQGRVVAGRIACTVRKQS